MRRLARSGGVALLVALVLLAVVRSHIGTRLDSFTVDEAWHIVAGTQYVRHGDFRLNPEHPPLTKLWVGLFMPDSFVVPPPVLLHEKASERDFVERVMFLENDSGAAQARARIAMWTLHGGMLFVLGLLLWRAAGLPWAAGALAVLAIEPTVAAHLPVVMTDLTLALALAIVVVAAALLAAHWQWRWVVATGVALGVALAAKHSALAGVAGIGLVLAIAAALGARGGGRRELLRRAVRLAGVAALGLAVLWTFYGLRFHAGSDGSDAFNRPMADKVADLNIAHWRAAIGTADAWQLLPRTYLWGLADTVRAGVEGRGESLHFLWGTFHVGDAPWFTWPSVLLSKLPLALLALALLAAVLLWRARLSGAARWMLWLLLGASALHLLALMGSKGTYGGVRHALPLVVAVALFAGAAGALAWQRRARLAGTAAAALFAVAVASTIGEPRVWEYHNVLAGGSAGAYRQFHNEGLDLGQRFHELRALHDRHVAPTGLPLYSSYWFGEEQAEAAGLNYRRRVADIHDTNAEGHYAGWFVYPMSLTLPNPYVDWDPDEVFAELVLVERAGYIALWRGRQTLPKARAFNLYQAVTEYHYTKGGDDWALVAAKLEEVLAQLPEHVGAAIELGNAYLRLGDHAAAARAYRTPLEQTQLPVEALVRAQIEAQLARLASHRAAQSPPPPPLRNPWME